MGKNQVSKEHFISTQQLRVLRGHTIVDWKEDYLHPNWSEWAAPSRCENMSVLYVTLYTRTSPVHLQTTQRTWWCNPKMLDTSYVSLVAKTNAHTIARSIPTTTTTKCWGFSELPIILTHHLSIPLIYFPLRLTGVHAVKWKKHARAQKCKHPLPFGDPQSVLLISSQQGRRACKGARQNPYGLKWMVLSRFTAPGLISYRHAAGWCSGHLWPESGAGRCGHEAPGYGPWFRVDGLPAPNPESPARFGRRAGRRGCQRGGHRVRRETEQRTLPALGSGGITGLNVDWWSQCLVCSHEPPFLLQFLHF